MQYHPENNPKEDLDATIPAVYARRSVQSLRSRPGAGVGEGDRRRIRGFRVPVVRPGLSRREDAAQALRGPGAFRVPAFPARGSPSSRRARGRGRRGGGRAAQVLADARPALRAPAAPEGEQPEAVRVAGGAGPGPVRLRDEGARLPAAGARAHRRRREERRAVHARVFRQRRRAGRVLRVGTPVRGGRSRARGVNVPRLRLWRVVHACIHYKSIQNSPDIGAHSGYHVSDVITRRSSMVKLPSRPASRVAAFLVLAAFFTSFVHAQERRERREADRRGTERERFHTPHWVYDDRFHHNHYYPQLGYAVSGLPAGGVELRFRGEPFFFHSGVWYRRSGPSFVVVRPPVGIVVPVLPPSYSTVVVGGAP